jgi:hypothetical protein
LEVVTWSKAYQQNVKNNSFNYNEECLGPLATTLQQVDSQQISNIVYLKRNLQRFVFLGRCCTDQTGQGRIFIITPTDIY